MKKLTTLNKGYFISKGSKQLMEKFYGKTIRLWRLLVAAMLLAPWILGLGTTSAYADGTHQVPFSASYSGSISFASNGVWLLNGNGIATHMGRSTNAGYLVFTTVPVDCAGGVPSDNHEALTAANGDSLTIVSHDVACPIGPNLYQGSGNWEVLGGTGRFTGATGQGTFVGYADLNQEIFRFHWTGTISAPGGE
jgi:hypothetical protein